MEIGENIRTGLIRLYLNAMTTHYRKLVKNKEIDEKIIMIVDEKLWFSTFENMLIEIDCEIEFGKNGVR